MSEDSEPRMLHAKDVTWASGLTVQDGMNLVQYLELLATCPVEEIQKHAKAFLALLKLSLEQTCEQYAKKHFPDSLGARLLSPGQLEAAKDKLDEILKRTKNA